MPLVSPSPQAKTDRVAWVHQQAWRTVRLALAFMIAAVIIGTTAGLDHRWAALHLFLVGGVLGVISAATQLFAVTWSTAPAPPHGAATMQRWLLAAGAAGLVIARHFDLPTAVVAAAAAAVLAALVLLALLLLGIRSRASTPRFRPAIDCYLAAIVVGIVGSGAGTALASGGLATVEGARDAHITINLFGLVGLVVLGTLPSFVATQVRTKMSPRLSASRLRGAGALMVTGTLVATTGVLVGSAGLKVGGFIAYFFAIVAVVAILPKLGPRQRTWAGPRLAMLLAGVGWWAASALWAAAIGAGATGTDRLWTVLAVGGYGQLIVGSLAYIGPIIRGRDAEAQQRAFAITRSWWALATVNVAAASAAAGWWSLTVVALVATAVDLVVRGSYLVLTVKPAPIASGR